MFKQIISNSLYKILKDKTKMKPGAASDIFKGGMLFEIMKQNTNVVSYIW